MRKACAYGSPMLLSSNRRVSRLALRIPVITLVFTATAIPVELLLFGAADLSFDLNLSDIALNILGYVPVGVVLAGMGSIPAIILAGLVSAVAEASQTFTLNRFPSPIDVVCNVIGAVIGVLATRRWPAIPVVIIADRRVGAVATIVALAILSVQALPGKQATLENWDQEMHLAAGDELTHDRFWHGRIHELAIVTGALDAGMIQEMASQQSFAKLPLTPAFGPVRNLDLAEIRGQPLLPAEELRRLHEAIVSRGSFSVLVRFRTEQVNQTGPARIVTYSRDPYLRNFTLAQENRRLVFRVRTPSSGLNGTEPELQTAPILTSGKEMLAVASYDGHISRVYVDGLLVGRANLSAAGKLFPDLADTHLPLLAVGLGTLVAIGMIGLWQFSSHAIRRLACPMGGLAGGLLLLLTGGAATLPAFQPWIPVLGLAGGAVVGVSLIRNGKKSQR